MSKTTIVLADDHFIVRYGLGCLLGAEPDLSVVGEAENGLEAVQRVKSLNPDVLVVDLMMPGLSGLEVVRQVAQDCPGTRIVVLSMHADDDYVQEALRHGAVGYVLKGSSTDDLVKAVRKSASGGRYLSENLMERAVDAYVQRAKESRLDTYDTFTRREREVFHLAAEGHSSAEISARLFISPRTVENHRGNLMRKLGLRTQADLFRYAVRKGIIRIE